MIIVKVAGGLGNQLFHYAFARALAARGHEVKIDSSTFTIPTSFTKREYMLGHFAITLPVATKQDFKSIGLPYPPDRSMEGTLYRLWSKLVQLFSKKKKVLVDHSLTFDASLLEAADGTYLSGAWTNERYFENIRDVIISELSLASPLTERSKSILAKVEGGHSVAVHIRRADYLKYAHKFVLLSREYYEPAVRLIREKAPHPRFFIFSDDIAWVQKELGDLFGEDPVYVTGNNTDYEDLFLLSSCRDAIIANSTFSWWGAWLNRHSDKMIIAPKRYRSDAKATDDLYPRSWIQL